MKRIYKDNYRYKDTFGRDSVCGLEVYRLAHDNPGKLGLVVATELETNTGMSITNSIETLAKQVCKQFDLSLYTVLWFESYARYGDKRIDQAIFSVNDKGEITHVGWTPSSAHVMNTLIKSFDGEDSQCLIR